MLNDEAHHTHDEDSAWNGCIRSLHSAVPGGLAAQLDFTATPRHTKGQLFSWTVYDYPLKQAIIDGIVKTAPQVANLPERVLLVRDAPLAGSPLPNADRLQVMAMKWAMAHGVSMHGTRPSSSCSPT